MKNKKEFIDKLLFDYDLVETDKDCNYNISGALLDATLFNPTPLPPKPHKEYTKLRQFYAWIGFMVVVVVVSILLSAIIYFWSQAIVTHSLQTVPDINSNLA